jgi:hypothetical protein
MYSDIYHVFSLRHDQFNPVAKRSCAKKGTIYLQPDWSLVSGEALVRNLLISGKLVASYGPVTKAGWGCWTISAPRSACDKTSA